jgi:hypothetical protein
MIYINMGHGKDGEKIYSDAIQNQLFANAILWLGTTRWSPRGKKEGHT